MSKNDPDKNLQTFSEMKKSFWESPMDALFDRTTLVVVTGYCMAWFERQAWAKKGIPYLKGKRRCLYRKSDVLEWIEKNFEKKNVSTPD